MSVMMEMRPEMRAGGYSRYDGAVEFFSRVNSLLEPEFTVLDYGAGRGLFQQDSSPFRRGLRTIGGKVRHLVGVDVDDAILSNSSLNERHLIRPGEPLPFTPETFDLVLSDWVLEHIDEPVFFAGEVSRVLKSGGWFCARTPNKWGLTALAARAIPNGFHSKALRVVQPNSDRTAQDVFPTRYRLNTLRTIEKYFPSSNWRNGSYLWRGEPKYFAERKFIFRSMEIWNHFVPPFMATDLFVFLQKK